MGAYGFLAALPAVLGVTGFFAYLWFGQARIGGDIFKKIVDKLRADPNVSVANYGSMTPARIAKLVEQDASVRSAVNDQDRQLLRLLIIFQYATTALVFLVSAGLVAWSIWLVNRPEPLSIKLNPIKAIETKAEGRLVDLDPLRVEWTAAGKEEQISVFLENVDSHQRTTKHTVGSNVRSVEFSSQEVREVASSREYKSKNRIRAVAEWNGHEVPGQPQDTWVGIEVSLMLFGHLVGPSEDRTIHTLFATIDRSTENLPSDYCFSGDFVCYTSSGVTVVPLRSCNSEGEVKISVLDDVNWNRAYGLTYNGPDDPRIVRTKVSGAPSSTHDKAATRAATTTSPPIRGR